MSVPFNSQQGLVIFPVDIHGPNGTGVVRLALDTGATETTISRRALIAIGIDPAQANLGSVPVITGNGRISVPLVRLMKLNALGQQRDDFIVQAHTLPAGLPIDGVLGLDFIRLYRLVVDFKTGFLVLE